ncbi:MAG TPA: substrate-binding domain-containing protein [Capsulimonadaceae bacterium]|jgi:LacI family transcriptional regulator
MATTGVLYQEIASYIETGIENGKFNPARRLPSDMELARKFSASRPTVVRAMIELQNKGLIERRAGSGTYIRAREPASQGKSPQSVAIIAEGLEHTELLAPICEEITRQCVSRGLTLVSGDGGGDVKGVVALAEALVARGVDGVFFAPLELGADRSAVNRRVVDILTAAGAAIVLIDRDLGDFPARSEFDLVGIDNFAAGYELGRHLTGSLRKRIVFLARPSYPGTTDLRMAGVREAASRTPGAAVTLRVGDPGDVGFVGGILSGDAPDVIVCSNDRTAALLMQSLTKLNRRVPSGVAVAGFDDVRYATLLSVPLTTMRQPCHEIGVVAAELMADRLAGRALPARLVTLAATLIARESTAS